MQEDRRPNVAGQPLPADDEATEERPAEESRLDARLLRGRRAADGHEPGEPRPAVDDAP